MVLNVNQLTKKYGKHTAVDNISFSLEKGTITGLIGPNGAGKTTTIKCLAGLLRPTQGTVSILGKEISHIETRAHIAYIPEMPDIYPMLTVWEHMQFIAYAFGLDHWKEQAESLLAQFDLSEKKNELCKNLSKGMTQKVSILCGLLHNPQVIFVDEPMIGLDPKAIRELKKIFCKLKEEGKTVLISTHLLDNAESFCDSVIIMKKGKAIWAGAVNKLKSEFGHTQQTSLEDVFLEVTGDDPVE